MSRHVAWKILTEEEKAAARHFKHSSILEMLGTSFGDARRSMAGVSDVCCSYCHLETKVWLLEKHIQAV